MSYAFASIAPSSDACCPKDSKRPPKRSLVPNIGAALFLFSCLLSPYLPLLNTPASSYANRLTSMSLRTVAYTFTVTADTTNGALRFSAIGDAAKTLRWLVNIEFEEIAI